MCLECTDHFISVLPCAISLSSVRSICRHVYPSLFHLKANTSVCLATATPFLVLPIKPHPSLRSRDEGRKTGSVCQALPGITWHGEGALEPNVYTVATDLAPHPARVMEPLISDAGAFLAGTLAASRQVLGRRWSGVWVISYRLVYISDYL